MECPECFQHFDEKLHRPKALPCGHTFCLECLQNVEQCFIDRKSFEGIPLDLPDSQNVLTLMHTSASTSNSANILHVWCTKCEKGASEGCVDEGHKVTSIKSTFFQQALKALPQLQCQLDIGYIFKLFDKLDEASQAEVKQIMAGKMTPVDVLLTEGNHRWHTSVTSEGTLNEGYSNVLQYFLSLLRAEGIICKDLLAPELLPDTLDDDDTEQDDAAELNLTNISTCKDQASIAQEKQGVLASDNLQNKKCLKGLFCNKDPKWCMKILETVAPNVEELHLFSFHIEHLEAIQRMPLLRWLVLEDFHDEMGKKKEYEPPKLHHESKLEFLWVNLQKHHFHFRLCQALIKSHEESLRVLFTSLPSYHSDAIQFFDGIHFKNLRILMYGMNYCGSDNCHDLMLGLRKRFPDMKLMCFRCGRTESFDD